jgi:hypothetical protein
MNPAYMRTSRYAGRQRFPIDFGQLSHIGRMRCDSRTALR